MSFFYEGASGEMVAIGDILSCWQTFNQTNSLAFVIPIADIDPSDGGTVEKHSYDNGTNESKVVHYKVINSGHNWFGSVVNIDIQSNQII